MHNILKSLTLCAAIFLLVPSHAHALSCVAPQMNAQVFDNSAVIFEGTAIVKRELSKTEEQQLAAHDIKTKGGTLDNLKAFEFRVERAFKGVEAGEQITVLRNTYWGDTFSMGTKYLVVANEYAGMYMAPLCGNSMASEYAGEMLTFLENHTAKE